jgi:integrase/recombinase XerD
MAKQNVLRGLRIRYNPASELELPRVEKRLPKATLSAEEAEQILNLPNIHTEEGLRDRAILEVLYSTGIRRMEVINLTCSAIPWPR